MALTLQMDPGSSVTVEYNGHVLVLSTDAVWTQHPGIAVRTAEAAVVRRLADELNRIASAMEPPWKRPKAPFDPGDD